MPLLSTLGAASSQKYGASETFADYGTLSLSSSLTGTSFPTSVSALSPVSSGGFNGSFLNYVSYVSNGVFKVLLPESSVVNISVKAANGYINSVSACVASGQIIMQKNVSYFFVLGSRREILQQGDGASAIYTSTGTQPILVAGAPGGQGDSNSNSVMNASTSTSGNNGYVSGTYDVLYAGKGGTSGGGGGCGAASDNSTRGGLGGSATDGEDADSTSNLASGNAGAGGGGFFGRGGNTHQIQNPGGRLIYLTAITNGGRSSVFGGGGSGQSGGGGGGGYSGGGGGSWYGNWDRAAGGGGGSYANSSIVSNASITSNSIDADSKITFTSV